MNGIKHKKNSLADISFGITCVKCIMDPKFHCSFTYKLFEKSVINMVSIGHCNDGVETYFTLDRQDILPNFILLFPIETRAW